jgi:prophage regulatory protein
MKIVRLKKVMEITGLGRSTLYKMISGGTFPAPVSLGGSRSVGWVLAEVESWVMAQINARDSLQNSSASEATTSGSVGY